MDKKLVREQQRNRKLVLNAAERQRHIENRNEQRAPRQLVASQQKEHDNTHESSEHENLPSSGSHVQPISGKVVEIKMEVYTKPEMLHLSGTKAREVMLKELVVPNTRRSAYIPHCQTFP